MRKHIVWTPMMRVLALFGCLAATAQASLGYVVPADTPAYIRHAVDLRDRSSDDKSRDTVRKPAELLKMSGVRPGDQVVEFASFGQYFTVMLSDIAGSRGKVYMYDLPYTEKESGEASRKFAASHPNVEFRLVDYNQLQIPPNIDVVFNVLYYHDLALNSIDVVKLNKRIFQSLKPGGVFFVVDHNATPGTGIRDEEKLHRIDPKTIRDEVTAAGFELVAESKLLANPHDTHTLISYEGPMRGITDQTVFKFRKPK